jgi:hypothetical protein
MLDPGAELLDFVIYSSEPGSLVFELFDLTGRQLLHIVSTYSSGADRIQIPANGSSQGTYIYRITDPTGSYLKSGRVYIGYTGG